MSKTKLKIVTAFLSFLEKNYAYIAAGLYLVFWIIAIITTGGLTFQVIFNIFFYFLVIPLYLGYHLGISRNKKDLL